MIIDHYASFFHLLAVLGWPGGTLSGDYPAKRKPVLIYTILLQPPKFSCWISMALHDKDNDHLIEYTPLTNSSYSGPHMLRWGDG